VACDARPAQGISDVLMALLRCSVALGQQPLNLVDQGVRMIGRARIRTVLAEIAGLFCRAFHGASQYHLGREVLLPYPMRQPKTVKRPWAVDIRQHNIHLHPGIDRILVASSVSTASKTL
jgi:hypothetical protein